MSRAVEAPIREQIRREWNGGKGLSQTALAAKYGISQQSVSNICKERFNPPASDLRAAQTSRPKLPARPRSYSQASREVNRKPSQQIASAPRGQIVEAEFFETVSESWDEPQAKSTAMVVHSGTLNKGLTRKKASDYEALIARSGANNSDYLAFAAAEAVRGLFGLFRKPTPTPVSRQLQAAPEVQHPTTRNDFTLMQQLGVREYQRLRDEQARRQQAEQSKPGWQKFKEWLWGSQQPAPHPLPQNGYSPWNCPYCGSNQIGHSFGQRKCLTCLCIISWPG